MQLLEHIRKRIFSKKQHGMVALTYANDAGGGGAGSQLQRVYGVYALSRLLRMPYIHSPLKEVSHHDLAALESNSGIDDLVDRYNTIFTIPSDVKATKDLVVHYLRNPDKQSILAIRKSSRGDSKLNIIKILLPYKILEKNISAYYAATEVSPFDNVCSNAIIRIAIHVRRGDLFVAAPERILPNSYYIDIVERIINKINEYGNRFVCELYTEVPTRTLNVASDHHGVKNRISESVVLTPSQNNIEDFDVIPSLVKYIDTDQIETLSRMATADILIMSHSSFSYLAAVLNRSGLIIYHPFWHNPLPHWINTGRAEQLESALRRHFRRSFGRKSRVQ
jgi:hypothetical protein